MSERSKNALIRSINVDYAQDDVTTRFFRKVLTYTEYCEEESGNVECPTGYFVIVRIDPAFRIAWNTWSRVFDDAMPGESGVPDGWYYVKTDSNGLVWALSTECPNEAEDAVRACFAESSEIYCEWEDSE